MSFLTSAGDFVADVSAGVPAAAATVAALRGGEAIATTGVFKALSRHPIRQLLKSVGALGLGSSFFSIFTLLSGALLTLSADFDLLEDEYVEFESLDKSLAS